MSDQTYEIRLSGPLDPGRADWFRGLSLAVEQSPDGSTITVLTGPVADRAALFGILSRIRDQGLALISVNPTLPGEQAGAGCAAREEDSK